VQYRPGSDLVVRFRASVRSGNGHVVDTLLAATTAGGPLPGTLHVEADVPDGPPLRVGVWRWPFDPILTALEEVVTPDRAQRLFGDLVGGRPGLTVVSYRPTERAVVRVEPSDGRPAFFVKVVAPGAVAPLVDRHVRLHEADLPVPRVIASGTGWFAMEEIPGPTLRDRVKLTAGVWPASGEFASVIGRLTAVDGTGLDEARSRVGDAPAHAAMLATVLPTERSRLGRITDLLRTADSNLDRTLGVVHGDLHEAQLVVDGSRIVGLLDVDDVGLGDPVDDAATLVGHLLYRGTTTDEGGARVLRYAETLRNALRRPRDAGRLDVAIAATLVGLATGPFRIQQPDWVDVTRRQLDVIEEMLDGHPVVTNRRSPKMRKISDRPHDHHTLDAHDGDQPTRADQPKGLLR
jgi:aminoglycoside phosphotransferase (APT) family kinase protein